MASTTAISENFVEYVVIPDLSTGNDKTTRENLLHALDEYLAALSSHLVGYIWQNEPFVLQPVDCDNGNTTPHLCGCTKFGDNIDDEWFIVFLLAELTKKFPDIIVRVNDNDGEFLLIEMAEVLPKWMTPETTENRVFFYQGALHVIPYPKKLGPTSRFPSDVPSLTTAVNLIRKFASVTKCSGDMQEVLFKRINRFPQKIAENLHRAHCYIPASIAAILQQHPSLISVAVNAFYTRDPLDLKICQKMKYFPPETRVMTDVMFTKCLYAQLMQQKYTPDKLVGWNIPPPHNPLFKSYDLGMKLACGFEILVGHANSKEKIENISDLGYEMRWLRYVKSLYEKGYFQGELEGSKLYKELLQKANQFYNGHRLNSERLVPSPGVQILNLLDTIDVDMDQLKLREKNLPQADDDDWLNITPQAFEDILNNTFCQTDGKKTNLADDLKTFVNHRSGLEGVECPKLREKPSNKNTPNRITFDPDSFADACQSILDFKIPDWEDGSSSDMSDYSDDEEVDEIKPKNIKSKKMLSKMEEYIQQMDNELKEVSVDQRMATIPETQHSNSASNHEDPENKFFEYSPASVDLSALTNLLESYHLQQGASGPAGSLLASMGMPLAPEVEEK